MQTTQRAVEPIMHEVTALAQKKLVAFLEEKGNILSPQHTQALLILNESFTNMAEGRLKGRLAFGLPTGTGKTTAIIQWCAAAIELDYMGPLFSVAVSSSRIDALKSMRALMIEAGIPADQIGLLHESPQKGRANTDDENAERPILLMSHQMIRSSEENLQRYNTFMAGPRSLLLYDESLLTTETSHFDAGTLSDHLAAALSHLNRNKADHPVILPYLTTCRGLLESVIADTEGWNETQEQLVIRPTIAARIAARYADHFEKQGNLVSPFLRASNLDMRLVKHGKSALVSYRIAVPDAMSNIIILDASWPVRYLCRFDEGILDAERVLGLDKQGIKFETIKSFEAVNLYRLRLSGSRTHMKTRFQDGQVVKEVMSVVKTIPKTDSILFFVYKTRERRADFKRILERALDREERDPNTYHIETFGNETSLNTYGHCRHVILVGLLQRDATELMGAYLGQVRDLTADVSKETLDDIHLSERAHLAYQALSRGSCRFVNDGKAKAMAGYLIEQHDGIEEELSAVMTNVNWHEWKPIHLADSLALTDKLVKKVRQFLDTTEETRISSRRLKAVLDLDKVTKMTWTRTVRLAEEYYENQKASCPLKSTGDGAFHWRLEGSSFVKQTFDTLGFSVREEEEASSTVAKYPSPTQKTPSLLKSTGDGYFGVLRVQA